MKKLLGLMRVHQWYKNLLIFLPIVFGQQLLNVPALQKTVIGFISLCLVSSSGYIFNDIIDRKRDLHHPKAHRKYIAKGEIGVGIASVFAFVLLLVSVLTGLMLSVEFIYFIAALFMITQIYSLFLKNEAFADIITISVNFVLRAVSGAFVIVSAGKPHIWVSPWLLVCTFLLALFLAVSKRSSEIVVLGKNAVKYKPVLRFYSERVTSSLLAVTTSALLVAYTLYTFQSFNKLLVFTAPVAVYVIFRYIYLVYSGSRIPLSAGRFYRDARLLIGALVWGALTAGILYLL